MSIRHLCCFLVFTLFFITSMILKITGHYSISQNTDVILCQHFIRFVL